MGLYDALSFPKGLHLLSIHPSYFTQLVKLPLPALNLHVTVEFGSLVQHIPTLDFRPKIIFLFEEIDYNSWAFELIANGWEFFFSLKLYQ